MSSVEVLLASFDSPARARSLLTVRAAICSAVDSSRPWSSSPSLMWSYWRSRFLLHPCGMVPPSGLGVALDVPAARTRHAGGSRRLACRGRPRLRDPDQDAPGDDAH